MAMEYLHDSLREYLSSTYGIRPLARSRDTPPNTYAVIDSMYSLRSLKVECPKLLHLLEMSSHERMNVLVILILRGGDNGKFQVTSARTHPDSLRFNDALCQDDVILRTKTKVIRDDTEGLIKELRLIEDRASCILLDAYNKSGGSVETGEDVI